ncbi:unnamed protein product [Macrosiphum euphorbiae]|uniref:Uncharacterized protein n=1 Tax=Macrosiphum euphorbiae TaxID=13131 RepID=A0AAV0VZN1_9HEMI|nr:unnamed protein product [Macrosiphum euphorbiae]
MFNSLDRGAYEREIIVYQLIRGWSTVEYVGTEITTANRRTPIGRIAATTLDNFIGVMLNKTGVMDDDNIFNKNDIDRTWAAVPIRSDYVGQRSSIAYTAAFQSIITWGH